MNLLPGKDLHEVAKPFQPKINKQKKTQQTVITCIAFKVWWSKFTISIRLDVINIKVCEISARYIPDASSPYILVRRSGITNNSHHVASILARRREKNKDEDDE